MTLDITPEDLATLNTILKRHPGCYAFGSRVKGTAKRFSDLDLCFIRDQSLPADEWAEITEAFEESDLPFTVDVLDYWQVSPAFRAVIDRDKLPLTADTP